MSRYGWRRDNPDHRDHLYSVAPSKTLPTAADLRQHCPPVYDQGQIGSCTANAIAGVLEYDQIKQRAPAPAPFTPARLFIYYNERAMEGTVESDSGASIRDGIKSVAKIGAPPESAWPYTEPFTQKPSSSAYAAALHYEALEYARVAQVLQQMKTCLASGFPFVFGFTVYSSFESPQVARTGHVTMPSAQEQALGGHAVVCVGYNDAVSQFTVRNSWGQAWGDKGYCYFPYAYLLSPDLASDFWVVRKVSP